MDMNMSNTFDWVIFGETSQVRSFIFELNINYGDEIDVGTIYDGLLGGGPKVNSMDKENWVVFFTYYCINFVLFHFIFQFAIHKMILNKLMTIDRIFKLLP